MSSQAQIDANRLNAQLSTGPTTIPGKQTSRLNSFKHGAYAKNSDLTGEDTGKFAQRAIQYQLELQPAGLEEIFHVDVMRSAHEELDRVNLLENAAMEAALAAQPEDSENPLGEAILADYAGPKTFEKLARRRVAAVN